MKNDKLIKKIVYVGLIVVLLSGFKLTFADELATTTDSVSIATSSDPIATTTDVVATSTNLVVTTPDPTTINLEIETPQSTLYNGSLTVNACAVGSTPASVNGYCAVQQSGLTSEWSAWADDQFLSSIAGFSNDYVSNNYWGWFSNLEYGETALNKHILTSGEKFLVTLGKMPLQIVVSTTSPELYATTRITVTQYGFENWMGVWQPAASSTVTIGSEIFSADAEGKIDFAPISTTTLSLIAHKDGFIDSSALLVTPVATSTHATSTPQNPIVTTGSGSTPTQTHHILDVSKALAFLAQHQQANGAFSSSLYTDWAAIAFAAGPQSDARTKILNYAQTNPGSLISATDYERHAMALMALGINPYSGTSINYIQKIVDQFDGTQIGDNNLVNDDIFALFPLVKAGYSSSDGVVDKATTFILSKQLNDGSWESSVDLTSAAIQALSLVPTHQGVNDALGKAKTYLHAHQQSDGGFGSSFSSVWAAQAISSLGETDSAWTVNNANVQDYLYSLQDTDGGIKAGDSDSRIWATAYAIPAALNKPWASLLSSFTKIHTQSSSTQQLVASITTTTATSTIVPLGALANSLPTDKPVVVQKPTKVAVYNGPTSVTARVESQPENSATSSSRQSQTPVTQVAAAALGTGSSSKNISVIVGSLVVLIGGAIGYFSIKNKLNK